MVESPTFSEVTSAREWLEAQGYARTGHRSWRWQGPNGARARLRYQVFKGFYWEFRPKAGESA